MSSSRLMCSRSRIVLADMLEVTEARRRVLEVFTPLEPKEVLVRDALGLVVAETLRAPHPLPRFANSAMDGYALRGADAGKASEAAPVTLEVTGEIRAGDPGDLEVGAGTAVRIMTGAPLPAGAGRDSSDRGRRRGWGPGHDRGSHTFGQARAAGGRRPR